MIQKLGHTTIYVLNQDSAKEFYVDKLGLEVRTDSPMGNGLRWLTVGPKGQPDLEIILMSVDKKPRLTDEDVSQMRALVAKGALSGGVFDTADCMKTYEELVAKGVHFESPPKDQFYGIEAVFSDDSGNWFSLTQHKSH